MSVSQYQVIKTNKIRMISKRKKFISVPSSELKLISFFLGKDKCEVHNEVHFEERKRSCHRCIQPNSAQSGKMFHETRI